MMEKQGIVSPGITPEEKNPSGEKQAQQQSTTQQLDNDVTRQFADAAAKPLTDKAAD
jgi:hypothetical protein